MVSLLQLQYFREIAYKQNISKCAQQFFVSQSTLSNSLSRMEEDLGIKLFERRGKTLILSDAGKEYLKYVEAALNALDAGEKAIRTKIQESDDELTVETLNSLVYSNVIRNFSLLHPEFKVIHHEHIVDEKRAPNYEQTNKIIIAATDDLDHNAYNYYEFRKDPLYILVNLSHPLAEKTTVTVKDIRKLPYVLQEPRSSFRKFCDSLFRTIGMKPQIKSESNYVLLAETLKRNPDCATITSQLTKELNYYDPSVFAQIPITDLQYTRNYSLFWTKGREKLNTAAESFKQYVIETKGV